MKRELISTIIICSATAIFFNVTSCKAWKLNSERKANEKAGLGRLTNEEAENERSHNEAEGLGSITNLEVEKERNQNETAGFGQITNAEAEKERQQNEASGFGKFTNMEVKTTTGFAFVEGGTFKMGCDKDEFVSSYYKPAHLVTVSSFYICDHEVTQKEYSKVMETNPSHIIGDNRPVDACRWYDTIEFCNVLSIKEGLTPCYTIDKDKKDPNNLNSIDKLKWTVTCDFSANGYRLPTEAECEYAARGGRKSKGYKYSGGNFINSVAWYNENSGLKTNDVKTKLPNELGLYDMSGNVEEWCWDWSSKYTTASQTNPVGPLSANCRIVRGGGWNGYDHHCTVASRDGVTPTFSRYGFRLVRSCR